MTPNSALVATDLLDDLDQILERTPARSVDDNCRRQVAQDVRTHGLYGVQVTVNMQHNISEMANL